MANSLSKKSYSLEQVARLRDCMNLFTHRVEFQTAGLFDALNDELQAQSERLQPQAARAFLDCKALLEADISGWTGRFGKSLRRRFDILVDGRSIGFDDSVSPPTVAGLSLVDEKEIDVDVAERVYSQRLGEKSGDALAQFSGRLAGLLKEPEVTGLDNPFGPHVVAGATRDAMEGTFSDAEHVVLAFRTLTRILPVDLGAIYRDLDQFLQQSGVAGGAASRKVERPRRPESAKGKNTASQTRAEEVLNNAQLSEQVASALLARVAAMNPGFAASSGMGIAQFAGQGYPVMGQGPASIGGFPAIVPPPGPNFSMGQAGLTPANSPQMATLALLGAPVPGVQGRALQVVAPQLLQDLGQMQRDASVAALSQSYGAGVAGGSFQTYSTDPLRQLAASPSFTSNATMLDFTTIELVAMVFDFVFKESTLADGMKGVITNLQIPLLKAALIDRNFFASKSHPGRALLNRLSEVGRDWRDDDGTTDPTYVLVRSVVSEVAKDFEKDLDVFARALARLDAHQGQEKALAEPVEIQSAAKVAVEDKETTADAWARRVIRDRLARAPMPEFVVSFLGGPWLKYLCKLNIEHGVESEAVQRALVDTDTLSDSIRETLEPEQRRRIISRLPKLLGDLRAGCKSVGASDVETKTFFDGMFGLHSRIFKGMQVELPSTPAGQPEKVAEAPIDIALANAPEDMFREIAMEMEKGMWIEMQDDTGKLKLAKLSWISPQRTTYLFTTRQGHKAASLTPVQMAEWFRDDRARILDSEPVVDRALNVLLNELVAEPR